MHKFILIGMVLLSAANAASAQQPAAREIEITAHKVAGTVYLLEGGLDGFNGSNIAVLIDSDGIVLVDAQLSGAADKVLAKLKKLSDRPIRFVINTHCHGDHTGGNAAFQKSGATTIAHRNARERFPSAYCSKGNSLPMVTFESELTLHLEGEDVRLIKLPNGHTDGDVIVLFPKSNVVHTGDAFISLGMPGSDRMVGGNMVGMIGALERLIELVPEDVKIIPGHGPVASIADVRAAVSRLKGMQAVIVKGIEQGRTFEQLKDAGVLDEWKQFLYKDVPIDYYIFNFYRDLTALRLAR